MKCTLMNKNTEIALLEYNEVLSGFDKIYEIIDINYAPLILKKYYEESKDELFFLRKLGEWFKGRGIPSWRDKLDLLLYRLNISAPSELLDKAFGLSLSDQYWIKPDDLDIKYDDINFFDHDFDYSEFMEASLSLNSKTIKSKNSLCRYYFNSRYINEDYSYYWNVEENVFTLEEAINLGYATLYNKENEITYDEYTKIENKNDINIVTIASFLGVDEDGLYYFNLDRMQYLPTIYEREKGKIINLH